MQLRPTSLPDAERAAANRWGQAVGLRLRRPKGHRGHPIPLPPVPYVAGQDLQARFARLGKVVGLSAHSIQAQVIQQLAITPYAPVTIRTDVPAPVRDYIKERQEQFPGVDVKRVFLRKYPYHQLAAQIVGNIGQVSPQASSRATSTATSRQGRSSARTAWSTPTTATCAGATA